MLGAQIQQGLDSRYQFTCTVELAGRTACGTLCHARGSCMLLLLQHALAATSWCMQLHRPIAQ